MKSRRLLIICIAVLTMGTLMLPMTSRAQTMTDTQTGGTAATGVLDVLLTVQTAITLSLTGGTDGADTTALSSVSTNTGDLDFGTVSAITGDPTTGARIRLTAGGGAHFVGTLDATVDVSGAANAELGIESAGTGSITGASLRYSVGVDEDYLIASAGTQVPTTTAGNELGATLDSGDTVTHQIAVYIADTQATGALAETITYTATPNYTIVLLAPLNLNRPGGQFPRTQ